jgi:uncharacterized iron-regulated membrane protein
MKPATKHRIHRTLGIIIVPLVLLSALTGFFRANHKWFWEEGYKKKKHPSAFTANVQVVPVEQVISLVDSIEGGKKQFTQVSLRDEAGTLYYDLSVKEGKKYLVRAEDAKLVSPLDSLLACKIAAQYVKEEPPIRSCAAVMNYITRKEKEQRAVYKVVFDNEVNSEIYIDYRTGDIVEDIDDNRWFGMLMVKLHDYDFWSSKRVITSIVGIAVVLLGLSGLLIYRRKKRRTVAATHIP